MRVALLAVLDDLRAARPGATADALTIGDLQRDRGAVAQELRGVEYDLVRLRQLGFARSLQRWRRDGGDWTEAQDLVLARELADSYFRHRDRDPALFDDTLPCLQSLRPDYRIGLLSNGSRLPEAIGLGGMFEVVVFAQEHRVAKPDRGIFEVVEQQMKLAPSACVLVGDHPLNDVVGAKRSGWHAIWLDREGDGTYRPPPGCVETPHAVITSLDELSLALKGLCADR